MSDKQDFVMVPREATREMLEAADTELMTPLSGMSRGSGPSRVWRVMLQTAPPAPAPMAGDTLEDNVRYLLEQCPFTVRDKSGDRTGMRGREDLAGSLAITFLKMQAAAVAPPAPVAVQPAPVADLVVTDAQPMTMRQVMEIAKNCGIVTGDNLRKPDGHYYCRSLGTPTNVRDSDLVAFARAILAAQSGVPEVPRG